MDHTVGGRHIDPSHRDALGSQQDASLKHRSRMLSPPSRLQKALALLFLSAVALLHTVGPMSTFLAQLGPCQASCLVTNRHKQGQQLLHRPVCPAALRSHRSHLLRDIHSQDLVGHGEDVSLRDELLNCQLRQETVVLGWALATPCSGATQ